MKKLNILVLLFAVIISFTGCSDEDDASSNNIDFLVKTWSFNEISSILGALYQKDASNNQVDLTGAYITFNADGTYATTLDRDNINQVLAVFSNPLDGSLDVSLVSSTPIIGTWEFTGGETQIIMNKGMDNEFTVDISLLTESALNWSMTFESIPLNFKMTPQ